MAYAKQSLPPPALSSQQLQQVLAQHHVRLAKLTAMPRRYQRMVFNLVDQLYGKHQRNTRAGRSPPAQVIAITRRAAKTKMLRATVLALSVAMGNACGSADAVQFDCQARNDSAYCESVYI
jgi:hypothetical protein